MPSFNEAFNRYSVKHDKASDEWVVTHVFGAMPHDRRTTRYVFAEEVKAWKAVAGFACRDVGIDPSDQKVSLL